MDRVADLMGNAFDELPSEQKLENLRRVLRSLDAAMSGLSNGPRRSELLALMEEVRGKISALRQPNATAPEDINKHFIDVARQQLNPYQFKQILFEAMRRANPKS